MDFFRSILFALVFYPGTALAVLWAGMAAFVGREALIGAVYAWARFHRFSTRPLLGIKTTLE